MYCAARARELDAELSGSFGDDAAPGTSAGPGLRASDSLPAAPAARAGDRITFATLHAPAVTASAAAPGAGTTDSPAGAPLSPEDLSEHSVQSGGSGHSGDGTDTDTGAGTRTPSSEHSDDGSS